jgi:hypothetical protein
MADFAAVETTPVVNEAPVVTPTGPSQLFRVFSINGSVSLVRLSVAGGCNIHARISEHMNAEINAAETRPAERRERKFQVVFGNAPIEELYNLVFAPGAKDAPGWDELFDEYYFETFVMAKEHCCYNAMSQHRGDRNARCVRASWTETLSETLRVARVERTTGHETLKVYYVMYKLTVKGVYKTLSILKL